jgi:predicted RNA polymerase sigma factor
MAFGSEVGLALVDRLVDEGSLREYAFLPSVRADLLAKLGRFAEAREEIARAISLTKNAPERAMFQERAAAYRR